MEEPDKALIDQKRLGQHIINQSLVANNPADEHLTVGEVEVRLEHIKASSHKFNSNDTLKAVSSELISRIIITLL